MNIEEIRDYCLDLAGIDPPENYPLNGQNLRPLLQAWRREMGVPYPLEATEAYRPSSIPENPDNSHRSHIYRLKKPKRK
jgi:hypothetical protein